MAGIDCTLIESGNFPVAFPKEVWHLPVGNQNDGHYVFSRVFSKRWSIRRGFKKKSGRSPKHGGVDVSGDSCWAGGAAWGWDSAAARADQRAAVCEEYSETIC